MQISDIIFCLSWCEDVEQFTSWYCWF